MVLATSSLVVWHDHPSGSFPPGDHVFAADREPVTELVAALRADLVETHLVPVVQLRAEPPESRPLRLTERPSRVPSASPSCRRFSRAGAPASTSGSAARG